MYRKYIFACLLFISSCQTSPNWSAEDIIVKGNESLQSETSLSAVEVNHDISFLIYALENGYGGRKYIPGGKFKTAIASLQGIEGRMPSRNFHRLIDEILLLIPDNHLKARLDGSDSPMRSKRRKNGNVGKNRCTNEKIWEVKRTQENNKQVLYISITKFVSHKDPVWNGFINSVKMKMQDTDLAIIDFRGNGGGDDTMGLELAEVMYGGKSSYPISKQYISQTPETIAISINGFQIRSMKIKKSGANVPSYYEDLKREKMKEFKLAKAGMLPPEKIRRWELKNEKFDKKKGYSNPIYILMDGKCGSSCESTIDGFESRPYVKKVGENTAGYIHFGNIGYILLPHSKIEIQTPTHYNKYRDGRFLEILGIKPDIKVPKEKDAYSYLFSQIVL